MLSEICPILGLIVLFVGAMHKLGAVDAPGNEQDKRMARARKIIADIFERYKNYGMPSVFVIALPEGRGFNLAKPKIYLQLNNLQMSAEGNKLIFIFGQATSEADLPGIKEKIAEKLLATLQFEFFKSGSKVAGAYTKSSRTMQLNVSEKTTDSSGSVEIIQSDEKTPSSVAIPASSPIPSVVDEATVEAQRKKQDAFVAGVLEAAKAFRDFAENEGGKFKEVDGGIAILKRLQDIWEDNVIKKMDPTVAGAKFLPIMARVLSERSRS